MTDHEKQYIAKLTVNLANNTQANFEADKDKNECIIYEGSSNGSLTISIAYREKLKLDKTVSFAHGTWANFQINSYYTVDDLTENAIRFSAQRVN